ncbi:exodeoxyribonuclease VII small subunit [Congregibacter variabilis]|uniref:exodeoxyribonuclease VII small subunit n=1 Tax=Congregibacter variabilis TaxID=3081200 RepID=UPI00388DA0AC
MIATDTFVFHSPKGRIRTKELAPKEAKKSSTDTDRSLASILDEIDTLVRNIESEEVQMEEALSDFERGVALTTSAQKILTAAEQRVRVLTGEDTSD